MGLGGPDVQAAPKFSLAEAVPREDLGGYETSLRIVKPSGGVRGSND